ncbi:glycerate kinase, partial [Oscillibacter sp. CAG:155]|uniref:glycerate kinase family protein n=1 Tax=Oscillibacter sp. CAG:155 TaxID=1262910 RepID=UPI00263F7F70
MPPTTAAGGATNDGGCGCAAALGIRFLDQEGNTYVPTGGTLDRLARIDASGLDPAVRAAEITVMCDIDNPLCGPTGASAVFGPQKGAGPAQVACLDRNLRHLAEVIRRDLGTEILDLPGSGAAGGMGGGMVAFLGGRLQMGIETVLDTVGFDTMVQGATAVLTGEGRIDGQSLRGKVVIGVARRAAAVGVPVIAVVGDVAPG